MISNTANLFTLLNEIIMNNYSEKIACNSLAINQCTETFLRPTLGTPIAQMGIKQEKKHLKQATSEREQSVILHRNHNTLKRAK